MSATAGGMETEMERGKKRLVGVEPALALYFMVFIPSVPMIQQFIYAEVSALRNLTLTPTGNQSEGYHCEGEASNTSGMSLQQEVQRTTSHWVISIELAETFPSLLASLLFGPMSDVVGRKKAILAPIIGSSLKYGIYLCVMAWHLPLTLLILAGVCDGVLGGQATIMTACFAYIADCFSGKERTIRMTVLDVTFGVCGSTMMIVFGYFISSHGFFYPFFLLIGLNILNIIYVTFCIPEAREKIKGIKLCSRSQLMKSFLVVYKPKEKDNKWKIISLMLACGSLSVVVASRWGLQTLFVLSAPLCWSPVMIGYFRAYQSIVMNIGNLGLTIFLVKKITEVGLVILSCLSSIGFMVLLSLSSTTWMMFLVPVVGIGGFIAEPMLKALAAQQVPADDLGALLAGIGVVDRLCGMLGGAAMMAIYGGTLHVYRGFVFLVLASGYFFIMGLMIYFAMRRRQESRKCKDYEIEIKESHLIEKLNVENKENEILEPCDLQNVKK